MACAENSEVQVHDIIITHFVNPHEFWYKYETNSINEELYNLEFRIQSYFMNEQRKNGASFNIPYKPKIHEIVAVLNLSDNRWIRAVVDHIYSFLNGIDKYILWAIDYGKPLMSPAKYIRKLPEQCGNHNIEVIFFGGLNNILPGDKVFDFITSSSKIAATNKWAEKSIKTIQEIIEISYTSTFRIEKLRNEQHFGQLEIITNMNKKLNITNVLIEINEGIYKSDHFYEILDEYQLNKSPRWLQPNGNCNLFKFNHNNQNMVQKSLQPITMDLNQSPAYSDNIELNLKQSEKNEERNLSKNNSDLVLSVNIEDEISGNEKIKIWQEKNSIMPVHKDVKDIYEDLESISIVDNQNYIQENKIKMEEQQCIGRMHTRKDLNEKLKISRPPRDNDICIAPEFKLVDKNDHQPTINKIIEKDVTIDDKKSNISTESDPSTQLKILNEMKKRFSKHLPNKKQNDTSNTINVPAGYDLGQLQTKNNHNKTKSSSSSNGLSNDRKQHCQIQNSSEECAQLGTSSGKMMPMKQYEQQKLNNQSSMQPSNTFRNSQRMKVDNTLHNVNEVCLPTCSIAKDALLVHGEFAKPIDKITEAKFTSDIHTEMERLRISSIYRIQQYAWPHLARFNSLILINSERTGKTYSYLPIICSLINMQKDDGVIPDDVGPIGIIIIPIRSEAEKILHQCRRFTKKNVLCTGNRNKINAMGDLQNNADLLICTPEGIDLLINNNLKCFSQKRIKHLIIENLNLWNEKNREILKKAFKKFHSNVQIIITSQIWDPTMEKLLSSKALNNPLLCIGAHIESAVYAKTNFQLKIMKKIFKIKAIIDFIKEHNYRDETLIIVCNNDDDVEEVSKNLKDVGYSTQSCTNRMQADDITEITRQWFNSNQENFILITSDDSLVQLKIQNAQNLIHYTLSTSWTRTCNRFSVFLRYYSDRIMEPVINKPQTNTLILLDEDNNDQLPKLVNFLERSNSKIDSKIKKLANKIEIEREKQKNNENRPLCEKWLEFNKIHNKTKCSKRHLITYIDAPSKDLPNKGYAEIQIISCESPIHYCVRILKHKFDRNDDWQITCQSYKFIKFKVEFSKFFSNSDNHQIYYPIIFNDLCVVKEHDKYERGKIIEIVKIKSEISKIYIKLIDCGQLKVYKKDQLLFLPDKFKEFPPEAVDLYLTDVLPYDDDEVWDRKSTDTIRKWIEKYNNEHRIIAFINFSLCNIIYADEIVIQEYLEAIKEYNNHLFIKSNAIKKEFVKKIDNNFCEIRSSAEELFQKPVIPLNQTITKDEKLNASSTISSSSGRSSTGEISINKYSFQRARPRRPQSKNIQEISENATKKLIVEEKWNMLIENEDTKISIGCFNSPNNFYVQILQHNAEKLNSLYNKIDNFIDNGAKSVEKPQIGENYLAKICGKYNRCKITSLNCDSNEIISNVFFCDIGSYKNYRITELMTTNSEIINALPYQAIHCSLIGILSKNINGIWTDNDSDNIYKLVDIESMYARPMINAKENNDDILKYWKYEIILINCSSDIDIQINKEIIKLGYAIKDPDTAHYLDFVYIDEYNDDEEDWEDNPNSKPYKFKSQVTDSENGRNDDNDSLTSCDVNFTKEEFMQFFQIAQDALIFPPNDDNSITEFNVLKPILENNKNNNTSAMKKKLKNITKNQNVVEKEEKTQINKITDVPKLIPIFKIPAVIWQQSEELICLKISAPDIKDYRLHVTNTNLKFAAIIDDEMNVLNLNLFGVIDESIVSHEIRGLNVIVRLLKKITGKRYSWPRLTNETDKHNWLKYNYEAIILEHEQFENSVQPENRIEYESDSDDEFVENIEYETYNHIENPDNVYDVLGDD